MPHHPRAHDLLVGQLMRAADELQDHQVNQLIGLAVMADIEVSDVLYETNAELVRLTARAREAARSASSPRSETRP